MIIITENITQKKTVFAENDAEYTESLFHPVDEKGATNERGTLALFHRIERTKNAVFYWVDEKGGYFERNKDGIWGQFGIVDGGKWCQWTLAEITRK